MDRGVWRATVHGVAKSSRLSMHACIIHNTCQVLCQVSRLQQQLRGVYNSRITHDMEVGETAPRMGTRPRVRLSLENTNRCSGLESGAPRGLLLGSVKLANQCQREGETQGERQAPHRGLLFQNFQVATAGLRTAHARPPVCTCQLCAHTDLPGTARSDGRSCGWS